MTKTENSRLRVSICQECKKLCRGTEAKKHRSSSGHQKSLSLLVCTSCWTHAQTEDFDFLKQHRDCDQLSINNIAVRRYAEKHRSEFEPFCPAGAPLSVEILGDVSQSEDSDFEVSAQTRPEPEPTTSGPEPTPSGPEPTPSGPVPAPVQVPASEKTANEDLVAACFGTEVDDAIWGLQQEINQREKAQFPATDPTPTTPTPEDSIPKETEIPTLSPDNNSATTTAESPAAAPTTVAPQATSKPAQQHRGIRKQQKIWRADDFTRKVSQQQFMDSIYNRYTALQVRHKELEAENERLSAKAVGVNSWRKEVEEVREKERDLHTQLAKAEARNATLESRLKQSSSEVARLDNEVLKQRTTIEALQKQLKASSKRMLEVHIPCCEEEREEETMDALVYDMRQSHSRECYEDPSLQRRCHHLIYLEDSDGLSVKHYRTRKWRKPLQSSNPPPSQYRRNQ